MDYSDKFCRFQKRRKHFKGQTETYKAERNEAREDKLERRKEEHVKWLYFALDTVSKMPHDFGDHRVEMPPTILRMPCIRQEEERIIHPVPIPRQPAFGLKSQVHLYYKLQRYVLNARQLRANGFPMELPGMPGMARFDYYTTDVSNPTNRRCTRCKTYYSVKNENGYRAGSRCTFHPGKMLMSSTGRKSSCCNNLHRGCETEEYHVSSPRPLEPVKCVKTNDQNSQFRQRVYFLDCEMCYTLKGLELTRISVVNSYGTVIYDTFVVPANPIIDYNTRYSGISSKDLKNVTVTLEDVQSVLLKYIHSKSILVGHGLDNDLRALRMIQETVVDTSVVFPHHRGAPYKRSLKSLVECYLRKCIQNSENGHDSVEDAHACAKLIQWKIKSDESSLINV